MKNIDKEPTYYVSLTEYNEVKRMFLKANDEINTLKDLLEECRHIIGIEKDFATCHFEEYTLVELLTKIDEALK